MISAQLERWVGQGACHLSIRLLIGAQVLISQSASLSPALIARNLLGILSLSLSLCPYPAHSLSVSLSLKINTL